MTLLDGVDVETLAGRWGVSAVIWEDEVTSTIDRAHALAEGGAEDRTVVVAGGQSKGRGRYGREWSSRQGGGAWLSYVMRGTAPFEPHLLSVRLGLTVVTALTGLGLQVMLKWPNDIMLRDKKLGGILSEARWVGGRLAWVTLGIGINVHGPLPNGLGATAIAIEEVQSHLTRLDVLDAVVPSIGSMSGDLTLSDAERRAYQTRDWLLGRHLVGPVAGVARGVDVDGALLVESEGRVDRVIGGSIALT